MRSIRGTTAALVGIAAMLLLLGQASAAPGDLDLSFGDHGVARMPIGQATGLVVQPDGKIVLGGWTYESHIALARFLPDGSLDSTFGSGGIVDGPSGQAYSIALQADGKILLAGWGANWNFGFFVARFLPNGSLDTTFGSNGRASGPGGYAYGITVQPDGHIVLAGADSGDGRFVLARFDPAGALDPGFGTNGVVRTLVGHGWTEAKSVVVQSDGKIVAAGSTGTANPDRRVMALARYLPDGSLDPAFGSGGTVTAAIGSTTVSTSSLALQANGRLIAAGTIDGQFGVARFLPDGSLDTSFATLGVATVPVGSNAYANGAVLQPDGRIVLAGSGFSNVAVVRFEPDGALDASFGEGGVAVTDLGSYGSAAAVALQADGKILAVGSSTLARYLVTTPSTITERPLVVEYGQSVQLTGVLTIRQPGWLSVRARRCGDSADRTAADTSVGANGIWAVSLMPEDQTEYRAVVGLERSAAVTVGVRPRLTLVRVSSRSLHARALYGRTLAGESIILQRRSKRTGAPWIDQRSLPLRRISIRGSRIVSGGTFRVQRRPGRKLRVVLRREGRFDCFETAVSPAIRG